MLAGRPQEAVGNGSPRWMTVAPRKRGHRTRPTGRLTPFYTCDLRRSSGLAAQFGHSSAGARRDPRSAALCALGNPGFLRLREAAGRRVPRTLPRLRARWSTGTGRLTGRAMSGQTARVVLAREALRAARVARTEDQFFDGLGQAGLLVRLRSAPDRPDRSVVYAVTVPGLADWAGQPVWFAGGTLDPALRLGELRARWRAGRPGAPPGADLFTGADVGQIYLHAAAVAQHAAAEIASARSGRADIAYAAADLLIAAAEATGSAELRRAAEGLTRAARAPWRRPSVPSPAGAMLRTAPYLPAGWLCPCPPADCRMPHSDPRARRASSLGRPTACCFAAQAPSRCCAQRRRAPRRHRRPHLGHDPYDDPSRRPEPVSWN